jgi:uncharacterized protein YuzE
MKVKYDPEADAAYIRLSSESIKQTQELSDVCILDLDSRHQIVGIELLSVFGFAGASLNEVVSRGLIERHTANDILSNLRGELVAV